jgi:endogenous inhibitor of DNA gyrase (YacG/DUF329 family)
MAAAPASAKLVPCPRCGALAPYSPENRFRPFCSERCKTIDLGAWANEEYRLPDAPVDETADPEGGSA